MAPISSQSSTPDAFHTLISHNPPLFYTVIALCCICLVFGTAYVFSKALKAWNRDGAKCSKGKVAPGVNIERTVRHVDADDSWMQRVQIRLSRGPSRSKNSPVFSPDQPCIFVQPAQHRGTVRPRSRHISGATGIPEFNPPSNSSQAYTSTFEPMIPPPAVDLVGLGLGTISFTSASPTLEDIPTSQNYQPGDIQEPEGDPGKDITDTSISIYSTESYDRYSPYVSVYIEEKSAPETLNPIFAVGSPGLPSPKLAAANGGDDGFNSSLPYLKQDTPTLDTMVNPFSDSNRVDVVLNDVTLQHELIVGGKSVGLKGDQRGRNSDMVAGEDKENFYMM